MSMNVPFAIAHIHNPGAGIQSTALAVRLVNGEGD